jgi:hypothetical protein
VPWPYEDRGEDERAVADGGVLFVAGGDAAPGLGLVEGALDDIATPVDVAITADRAASGRAAAAEHRTLLAV